LLTAFLGLLAAAFGVWGVRVSEDRDQLDDQVSTSQGEIETISEENDDLRRQVAELTESRDSWRDRAESGEGADGTAEGSPSAPVSSPQAEPELSVSPDSITAGQDSVTFEVTGEGFEPDEKVELSVYTDASTVPLECVGVVNLRTATANAEGSISTSETVVEECLLDHRGTIRILAEASSGRAPAAYIRIL
jgi:hypothetical protein